jgi:hypothetical protein
MTVVLPWASRDALLAEIRHLPSMLPVIKAFEDVGASRPVVIPQEQKGPLIGVLDFWMDQATVDGLPEGILELWNALIDDAYDAEQPETT